MPVDGYISPGYRIRAMGLDPQEGEAFLDSRRAAHARTVGLAYATAVAIEVGQLREEHDLPLDCVIEYNAIDVKNPQSGDMRLFTYEGRYLGEVGGKHFALSREGALFWGHEDPKELCNALVDARLVDRYFFLVYNNVDEAALIELINAQMKQLQTA